LVKKHGCADTFTINEAMEILRESLRRNGLGRLNISINCHMHTSEESADAARTMLDGEAEQAFTEQNEQARSKEQTAESPSRAENSTTPDKADEPPAWLAGTAGARQPAANSSGSGSVRRRLF